MRVTKMQQPSINPSVSANAKKTDIDREAYYAIKAAGFSCKINRYNSVAIICKIPNKRTVRYFPVTGKWMIYSGRQFNYSYGRGDVTKFIHFLNEYANHIETTTQVKSNPSKMKAAL